MTRYLGIFILGFSLRPPLPSSVMYYLGGVLVDRLLPGVYI